MWRRSLIILPRWLLVQIIKVNRFIKTLSPMENLGSFNAFEKDKL